MRTMGKIAVDPPKAPLPVCRVRLAAPTDTEVVAAEPQRALGLPGSIVRGYQATASSHVPRRKQCARCCGPRGSPDGKILAWRRGETTANFSEPLISGHVIAAGSRGDIYLGDVAKTGWGNLFPGATPPGPSAVLQRPIKVE